MILLIAVALGLICGWMRAKIHKQKIRVPDIHGLWLVFIAFLPQFLAFQFPATINRISDHWIPYILIGSLILLLNFTWSNRKIKGFLLMEIGLICNFIVIAFNGGFMPLMPEIAEKLVLPGSKIILELGERIGFGKDILLKKEDTILWFLGDVFTLPSWINYRVAFSIGDIFIAVGVFLLFWTLGSPHKNTEEVSP